MPPADPAPESGRLFSPTFFLMCSFTFTVFLSLFQLLPTAPYRILSLGGGKFAAGLFLGFLTYASALSAPLTGALADRIGRRRVLIISSLAIAGFSVAYALTTSWRVMIVLVFFHGIFWSGLLSASSAYMTGLIPVARRAEGISYWGMATVLATAFAPALGLWVFQRGWVALCGSVGVLNLVMAFIAWRLPETESGGPHAGARFFTRDLVEWRVLVVSMSLFLCSFGYGGVTSFVALWAEKNAIFPKSLYFTVFSLVVLVTRPFAGRVADAVGAKKLLLPCLASVAIAFLMLAFADTRSRLIASAALFGVGFGNLYPFYATHILKFVSAERRGSAFGGIIAAFDTGIGTGSMVLGAVIERSGFPKAFGLAAVLAAFSIPVFLVLEKVMFGGRPGQPESS
jgi:MFS family permease